MKAVVETSAVSPRYPGPTPAERLASVDLVRKLQLDELCRPVPGAKAERRRKYGTGMRAVKQGMRALHLYFPVAMHLEMGREAIRRGVNTSSVVREAWALAKAEVRKMPGKKKARWNPIQGEDVAWRMRHRDEFEAPDVCDLFPEVSAEHANTLLSRGMKSGLFERLRVGVYRSTPKAKTLRGVG